MPQLDRGKALYGLISRTSIEGALMARAASGLLGSSPTERPGYLCPTDARRSKTTAG